MLMVVVLTMPALALALLLALLLLAMLILAFRVLAVLVISALAVIAIALAFTRADDHSRTFVILGPRRALRGRSKQICIVEGLRSCSRGPE